MQIKRLSTVLGIGLIVVSLCFIPSTFAKSGEKPLPPGFVHFPFPSNFPYPNKFPIQPTVTPTPSPSPTSSPQPSSFYVVSNSTWKYSDVEVSGWKNAGFNDSLWNFVAAPSDGLCPVSAINIQGRINQNGADPIWSQVPVNQSTAYFRREFNLSEIPQQAKVRALFDDDGDIFLNGNLVLSSHNGFVEGIQTVDVTAFLQTGANVLAVIGIDSGGCQSMQVELAINPTILTFATDLPTTQNGPVVPIPSGFKSITFNVVATGLANWSPLASFDGGSIFKEIQRFGCCQEVTVPIFSNFYKFSPGSGTIVDSVKGTLNQEPNSQVLLFGNSINYPFTSSTFDTTGFNSIVLSAGGGDNPQNLTGISLQRFEAGSFVEKEHIACDGGAMCPPKLLPTLGGEYRVVLEGSGTGAVMGAILRK